MSVPAREVIEEDLRRSEERLRDIAVSTGEWILATLETHVADGDADAAGGCAHTIRGAAANVGAMALSATAAEMEKAARAGRPDVVAALLPELMRRFGLARDLMQADAG